MTQFLWYHIFSHDPVSWMCSCISHESNPQYGPTVQHLHSGSWSQWQQHTTPQCVPSVATPKWRLPLSSSSSSHWCEAEKGPPQFVQLSSLLFRRGELVRELLAPFGSRRFSGVDGEETDCPEAPRFDLALVRFPNCHECQLGVHYP